MDKKRVKHLLAIFLFTVTLFVVIKYVSFLKDERDGLLNLVNHTREQAMILGKKIEEERTIYQKVNKENLWLKDYLGASRKRLSRLFSVYEEAQKKIDDLNSRFSLLQIENSALLEEKGRIFQENEQLKVKLSSVSELKKAIKELRRQMRRVGTQIKEKAQTERIIEGNRGFLIKNGDLTYPAKVAIEVTPVPKKE